MQNFLRDELGFYVCPKSLISQSVKGNHKKLLHYHKIFAFTLIRIFSTLFLEKNIWVWIGL